MGDAVAVVQVQAGRDEDWGESEGDVEKWMDGACILEVALLIKINFTHHISHPREKFSYIPSLLKCLAEVILCNIRYILFKIFI